MAENENSGKREKVSRDIISDMGKTAAEKHFLEAILENGEVIFDDLLKSDLIKDLPVLGTAVKFCKTGSNIRDYLFAAKIFKFITNLNSLSLDEKSKFNKKLADNPEEQKRVGEIVLLTIDKLSDLEKPEIIAKVFLAYIDEEITLGEFQRITEAIHLAFITDLKAILASDRPPVESQEAHLDYLTPSGLTKMVPGDTVDEIGKVYFEFSKLGKKLIHAYKHGDRLAKKLS